LFAQVETTSEETNIEDVDLSKLERRLVDKIGPIDQKVRERFHDNRPIIQTEDDYLVQRLDLEFAIMANAGLKFIGVEQRKSLELVWERGSGDDFSEGSITDTTVPISTDEAKNYKIILKQLLTVLDSQYLTDKKMKKIEKRVQKDARKITIIAQELASFPYYRGWSINRFFKNYYFSAKSDLIYAGATYDKRIRLRFIIPQIFQKDPATTQNKIHRKLRKHIDRFEKVRSFDHLFSKYKLKRVWMVQTLNAKLNLSFLNVTKGEGVQIEFLYGSPDHFDGEYQNEDEHPLKVPVFRRLADAIEKSTEDDSFSITQLRFKGRLTSNFNFLIGGLSHFRTIEYHYRSNL
jgi:hypothetical protein